MEKILFLMLPLVLIGAAAAQTGSFFHNGSISISELSGMVKIEDSRSTFNNTNRTVIFDEERGLNMPTGMLVLIIAFLAIVVYATDFDPFWLAIILFLLLFSALVYYTSLPTHSIPAAIVLILGVKYFR